MGRIASALDALRLLCTTSAARARSLAQLLQDTNLERQQLTNSFVDEAKEQALAQRDEPVLVISSQTFHEGVIGLIAGRLVEEYQKPVVVIAVGEHTCKGSARSTSAVNIVESLRSVREHVLELGGHPMAAGFSINTIHIAAFTTALRDHLVTQTTETSISDEVSYDTAISPNLLTVETSESLEQFAPFGAANPKPVFKIENCELISSTLIGKKLNHRKFIFSINGRMINAIRWFDTSDPPHIHSICDIYASLSVETWRKKSICLEITAIA
jgi:single-stranded-DNA-specific exonuclease